MGNYFGDYSFIHPVPMGQGFYHIFNTGNKLPAYDDTIPNGMMKIINIS